MVKRGTNMDYLTSPGREGQKRRYIGAGGVSSKRGPHNYSKAGCKRKRTQFQAQTPPGPFLQTKHATFTTHPPTRHRISNAQRERHGMRRGVTPSSQGREPKSRGGRAWHGISWPNHDPHERTARTSARNIEMTFASVSATGNSDNKPASFCFFIRDKYLR